MLHPNVASDESAVARFRREARLAAQLAHPAIVPIYDWDSRGDVSWYTMELAEGGSVADLITRNGPRPFAEIAPQVDAVLDALVAAHANSIIHRDLKPENILIDRYRRWRITDFGIAKVAGEDAGGASGTPAFAAPEQLLGELQGPGVDCFAVAAIVVYVLRGRSAVPGPHGAGDPGAAARRTARPQRLRAGARRMASLWSGERYGEAVSRMQRRCRPHGDSSCAPPKPTPSRINRLTRTVESPRRGRGGGGGCWGVRWGREDGEWRLGRSSLRAEGLPSGSRFSPSFVPVPLLGMSARRRLTPDGLDVHELVQSPRAQLATVAGVLHTAEREARVGCHHAVDEHGSGFEIADEAICFDLVTGPRGRAEPEARVVRNAYRVVEVARAKQRCNGAEQLVPIRWGVSRGCPSIRSARSSCRRRRPACRR